MSQEPAHTPDLPHLGKSIPVTEGIQRDIATDIEQILGMSIGNNLLRDFINEFVHPRQILCGKINPLSQQAKITHQQEMLDWEEKFTQPVYRAAVIAARNAQRQNPQLQGVNIKTILEEAIAIIERDSDTTSAFEDTGYHR